MSLLSLMISVYTNCCTEKRTLYFILSTLSFPLFSLPYNCKFADLENLLIHTLQICISVAYAKHIDYYPENQPE